MSLMRAVRRASAKIVVGGAVVVPLAVAGTAMAWAQEPAHASGGSSLKVTVFAKGGALSQPDEVTKLGSHIFVAYQNGLHALGQPGTNGATSSTIVEYNEAGKVLGSWNIKGHCDGLVADPASGRLLATVNEDGNSSLYSITPGKGLPTPSQVKHYAYSLNPLPHGGGTDSVSIVEGHIFISASAPTVASGPAVYQATLSGGTANLTPVFYDNSSATVANTNSPKAGSQVKLALTDPDSSTVVPASAPRFAGNFVLDSQGDSQQVYVSHAGEIGQKLSVLNLSQSINDTAWVTSSRGTLYVTDHAANEVLALRGRFKPGTAYVAATPSSANNPVDAPNYLGTLNTFTGQVKAVGMPFQPQGLLFVPSDRATSRA